MTLRSWRRKSKRQPGEPTDIRTFVVHGGWGDSVQWLDFEKRRVYGFVPIDLLGSGLRRPLPGDLLESTMKEGRVGVFRFTETNWETNPHDMFFGTVEDVGWKDEE